MCKQQTETDTKTIRDAGYWAALYHAGCAVIFMDDNARYTAQVQAYFRDVRRFAVLAEEPSEHFIKLATTNGEGTPSEKREKALALFASLDVDGEE